MPAPKAALLTRAVESRHRGSGEDGNRMVRALRLPGCGGGKQERGMLGETHSLSSTTLICKAGRRQRWPGAEAREAHCANWQSKGPPVEQRTDQEGEGRGLRKLFKNSSFQLC